jgi:regulator of sigma E protease
VPGFSQYFQLFLENAWLYGGAFLLVLTILVFVHEWGHYIVARLCGVKIEVFSIGFGPEIFGFNDHVGTRWKFSLIPLGGYVKMFGDVDPASARHKDEIKDHDVVRPMTESERKEAFYNKPVLQRAAVVFAGPAINFLFAIILLAGLYMAYGKPVTPPMATAVVQGSAADLAGFEPHDLIYTINGKRISSFEDIRREVMIALDTPMEFNVERNGEMLELVATPEKISDKDRFGFAQSRGMLGILGPSNGISLEAISAIDGQEVSNPEDARTLLLEKLDNDVVLSLKRGDGTAVDYDAHPIQSMNKTLSGDDDGENSANYIILVNEKVDDYIIKFGPLRSLQEAVSETANITVGTLQALGQMVTGTRSATELGGIIRIGAIAGDMAQAGIISLITFTALLSINLGLINLFPIPVLDGGHLVFYAIEAVKGSPVSEDVQEYAFRFGVVVLVGLMLFANLNDLFHLIL